MPYINKEDRELIDGPSEFTTQYGMDTFLFKLDKLRENKYPNDRIGWAPGTLNYIITRLCDYWCRDFEGESNYDKYNGVIGVLECVKQELYRRQIAPYEDKKCEQNGDVYRNGTTK